MPKTSSLSFRVTNELRADITSGALEPGARLRTETLAQRYGVSANPIREALWRLQGEGFVTATPNQGARVRIVDDDFVRNIFEIREALEPLVIRRFCHRASAADIARLREAAAAFAELTAQKALDFAPLEAANRAFHGIIMEGEVNLQALEVMERYGGLINATRAKLPISPKDLRRRVHQHAEIIEAVSSGDVERATEVAAAHVRTACEDMLTRMRQGRLRSTRADANGGPTGGLSKRDSMSPASS